MEQSKTIVKILKKSKAMMDYGTGRQLGEVSIKSLINYQPFC